jgi:hypothetical protein
LAGREDSDDHEERDSDQDSADEPLGKKDALLASGATRLVPEQRESASRAGQLRLDKF